MRPWLLVFLIISMAAHALAADTPFDHSHNEWTRLLNQHVRWINDGTGSQVDYAGFQQDRTRLDAYLAHLSAVTPEAFAAWSQNQRLAFLINAYNAYTVALILTRYPDLDSIKDLGSLFQSPWKKRFFTLLGEKRHLDEIEHEIIRKPGDYDDPRIHMAVNCAAIGCPALRNEAYTAQHLDAQLDDGVRRYLLDRERNRYREARGRIEAGKIFDWYREDFERGYRGYTSLAQFFARHADLVGDTPAARERIAAMEAPIAFTDYNWDLNNIAP